MQTEKITSYPLFKYNVPVRTRLVFDDQKPTDDHKIYN